ncbi:ARM repeat-containing protein [Gyrodon lividus]|nr:ARM repeat-containing protein [Gyrodon lividus]
MELSPASPVLDSRSPVRRSPSSRTAKYRCDCSPEGRNLVVCIDGTSNKFGQKNTNIVELYSQLQKSKSQLTYYNSGVGTEARPSWRSLRYVQHWLSNKIDLLIAWNLEKVIFAAYRWIADNYEDGDRIYLFGFSRGAYQARALAGMIYRVGLILPGNNEQIPFAFELYSRVIDLPLDSTEKIPLPNQLAATFKSTFCRENVKIHFVGVWDTVSSVGIVRGKTLPSTTSSSQHICYIRHALALDERRVKFLPEYVNGGKVDFNAVHSGRVKEVWFSGTHSDVGGGNRINTNLQTGDIPLLWMRREAVEAGLRVKSTEAVWKLDDLQKKSIESLRAGWWLLEYFPIQRLVYHNSDEITSRPHRGHPRKILPGQKIHGSVLFKGDYQAKAKFWQDFETWPEMMYWNDPTSHNRLAQLGPLWEKDLFDSSIVVTLLDDIEYRPTEIVDCVDRLAFMASFDQGKNAIRKVEHWKKTISDLVCNDDPGVRVSAAVAYCELVPEAPSEDLKGIAEDVLAMLNGEKEIDQVRACKTIPSLAKHDALKDKLATKDTFMRMVQLGKRKEADATRLQLRAAQALAILADNKGCRPDLTDSAISELLKLLQSRREAVVVAALRIIAALVDDSKGSSMVCQLAPLIVEHLGDHDFYVSPPAAEVICAYAQHYDVRRRLLELKLLPILMNMLENRLPLVEEPAVQVLRELGQYADVQSALIQHGHVKRMKIMMASQHANTVKGGTIGLLSLIQQQSIRWVATYLGTINMIIEGLRDQDHSLFAAYALSRLIKIHAVRPGVVESAAPKYLLGMLERNTFSGAVENETGERILRSLMRCDDLRAAVIQAGAMKMLVSMLRCGVVATTKAVLGFLHVMNNYDDGIDAITGHAGDLVEAALHPLGSQRWSEQRNGTRAIHELAMMSELEKEVRESGIARLLEMLNSDKACEVLGAATALRALSQDGKGSVRVM